MRLEQIMGGIPKGRNWSLWRRKHWQRAAIDKHSVGINRDVGYTEIKRAAKQFVGNRGEKHDGVIGVYNCFGKGTGKSPEPAAHPQKTQPLDCLGIEKLHEQIFTSSLHLFNPP